MTSFYYAIMPSRGNWFQTNKPDHESEDQLLLCVLPIRNIRHFSGKFDQHFSLYCGSVKPKLPTGPGYWFLSMWIPKFTDNFGKVSSKIRLKASKFLAHWNNVKKNGTFILFGTSVNGNVTFACIMTFHCISAYKLVQWNVWSMELHELTYLTASLHKFVVAFVAW